MKTLKLVVELTYDDELMHADHPDDIDWFIEDVLYGTDPSEGLVLWSNLIGDEVGDLKVLAVTK